LSAEDEETPGASRASTASPGSIVAVEKVAFDKVNMLTQQHAFEDHIDILVNVPLKDGSVAETKVVLGSPVRFQYRDGRREYSMKVDNDLHVTQVQRRAGGRVDLQSRDGLWWEIPVGYPGASTVLLDHEPKVKEFLGSRFKPGHVFVDVGANVGAYSLRALSKGMTVYSFEPNPENIKILKRNAEINRLPAAILEFALGASEGTAKMSQNGATSRIVDEGIEVPVRALDSLNYPRVDLLKVDVEGYELEVFRGAKGTLARCHPDIMIEMHHWIGAEAEAEIFGILLANGYHFEYIDTYSQGKHLTAVPRENPAATS
jgi:FkbM family methyltransferase